MVCSASTDIRDVNKSKCLPPQSSHCLVHFSAFPLLFFKGTPHVSLWYFTRYNPLVNVHAALYVRLKDNQSLILMSPAALHNMLLDYNYSYSTHST